MPYPRNVTECLEGRLGTLLAQHPDANEVRLRSEGHISLVIGRNTLVTDLFCTQNEMEACLMTLCGGSLHAHEDSLQEGYIDVGGGVRAGVAGRITSGGQIRMLREISAINIRLPHFIYGISGELFPRMIRALNTGGTLIYSPPGEGKTTLLRDLALRSASGPKGRRVALIDSRGELYDPSAMKDTQIDLLSGYTKAKGIEIATRTLSPQLIICDEIGSGEADAILRAQNCGVPLIASAHASSFQGLMQRPDIRQLHDAGVFVLYAGIRRCDESKNFRYSFTENACNVFPPVGEQSEPSAILKEEREVSIC